MCEKCRKAVIEIKKITCRLCGAPYISEIQKFPIDYSNAALYPSLLFSKTQNPELNPGFNKLQVPVKDVESCPACREFGFSFFRLRSFGLYYGILKKIIIKFKYYKIYTLAPVLNSFLKKTYMENYINEKIDFMDTVPDFSAFRDRANHTYCQPDNHMQILAKMFSKETGIPYDNNIIKIKKTLKQQNLGVYERKINLEGVFKAVNTLGVFKKNILLIDDVWTTGNTLNEISKVLKNCGAQKIYLLTIARAI